MGSGGSGMERSGSGDEALDGVTEGGVEVMGPGAVSGAELSAGED